MTSPDWIRTQDIGDDLNIKIVESSVLCIVCTHQNLVGMYNLRTTTKGRQPLKKTPAGKK